MRYLFTLFEVTLLDAKTRRRILIWVRVFGNDPDKEKLLQTDDQVGRINDLLAKLPTEPNVRVVDQVNSGCDVSHDLFSCDLRFWGGGGHLIIDYEWVRLHHGLFKQDGQTVLRFSRGSRGRVLRQLCVRSGARSPLCGIHHLPVGPGRRPREKKAAESVGTGPVESPP